MTISRTIFLASTVVLLGACGGGYSADSIIDQAPQGLMAGADWTMMGAVVEDDGDSLSVSLYPTAVDPCDVFATADSEILFSVPKAEGEYRLNLSLTDLANSHTVTFVPSPGQNIVSTQGIVVVEGLSADEVTIGLIADADDNSVNGRFTTAVCAGP